MHNLKKHIQGVGWCSLLFFILLIVGCGQNGAGKVTQTAGKEQWMFDSTDAESVLAQAEIYANSDQPERGFELVNKALVLHPSPRGFFLRGYLQHRLGNEHEALVDVQAAWANGYDAGDNAIEHRLLEPKLQVNMGRADLALVELTRLIAEQLLPREDRDVVLLQVETLMTLQEYQQVIDLIDQVLKDGYLQGELDFMLIKQKLHFFQALCHLQLTDIETFKKAAQAVIDENPETDIAQDARALLLRF